MTRAPTVSVVVPVYNAEEYVAEALESVITQIPAPREVIVVDDGSTDASHEVVSRFPVTTIRQANAGPAVARNVGIQAASGDFVAFIDADDLWPDGKLKHHLAEFERDPSLEAVLGRYQLWVLDDSSSTGNFVKVGEPSLGLNFGAGVYRRHLFADLGFLSPEAVPSEDVDWYMRMKEAGVRIKAIDATTLEYRLHQTNITGDRSNAHSAFLNVLGDSIRRRRTASQTDEVN